MTLVTMLHLGAGTIALTAGGAALIFHKGGRLHRLAGGAFIFAMLAIFATGFAIVEARLSFPNVILAGYFPVTAWLAVRRKESRARAAEMIAMLVGAAAATLLLTSGIQAARAGGSLAGAPAAIYFVFGGVATLAVLLDLKMLLQGGVAGVSRIARHLWRMCYALFMACGAFFLGQQDFLPVPVRGSMLLFGLALAPLLLMFAWLVAVRVVRRFKTTPTALPMV